MVRIRESSFGIKQGDRIGSRLVLGPPFSLGKRERLYVVCRCECGRIDVVESRRLADGQGICKPCSYKGGRAVKHGNAKRGKVTRLYIIWRDMIKRCYNRKRREYKYYGGKGIRVCNEWLADFAAFESWAKSNGYTDSLTIDRIRSHDSYQPDNCRWITLAENVRRAHFGKRKPRNRTC